MTVTVYHKPHCVQCEATMRQLVDRGVAFTAVDLSQDEAALQLVTGAGYRTAPVVAVNGQIAWAGFRPDLIDALATGEAGA